MNIQFSKDRINWFDKHEEGMHYARIPNKDKYKYGYTVIIKLVNGETLYDISFDGTIYGTKIKGKSKYNTL